MEVQTNPPAELHSPPPPTAKRPRGILKNSFQKSPPLSPTQDIDMTEKEIVLQNTQVNMGHRRSSSAASRPAGSRRQSSRTPSAADNDPDAPPEARLKWDEANLYLTEQERTSTMKITEPKTPYAKHYSPSEDDDDEFESSHSEIPGLSLGEPEEEIPENEESSTGRKSRVHVNDEDATPLHDADADMLGMTPEEREKHRRFEQLRKKHYEMSEAVGLLGHPEVVDEEMEDDDDGDAKDGEGDKVPPVPKIPQA
ncbi:hypothetical protein KJ359_005191 [Pestalotiopsis sp. 9143b]|nr:hypothetical protein KJ359_005191 [Pestalotiopsis sp. 9143b]